MSKLTDEDLASLKRLEEQGAVDDAAWAAEWAAMTPEQQQAHREQFANLRDKMQSSVGGTRFDT